MKPSYFLLCEWAIALLASAVFYTIPATAPELQDSLVAGKYFRMLPCLALFAGAVVVWLVLRLRKPGTAYRLALIDGVAIGGTLYYLCNTQLWGSADPMRLIFAASILIWYAGLRALFASERIFRVMLLIMLCVAGYEAILGLGQIYGSGHSNHALYAVTGTFFNPGPYGGFLAVFCPITLYGLLTHRNSWRSPLYIISAIVFFTSIVVLPVTGSRTAWAAALIGCCAVLTIQYYPTLKSFVARHRKLSLSIAIASAAILMTGGIAAWHMKRDSAEGRLLLWKTTAAVIRQEPLTGCGFGHFAGTYGERQAEYFAENPRPIREVYVAGNPDDAFNEYLQVTAEGGFFGGILFALAAGFGLHGLWRNRERNRGLFFGAVSLLIFAAASYPFSLAEFILVGVFMLAAAAPTTQGIRLNQYAVFLLWTIVVLPLTILLWHHEKPREQAYAEWRTDHLMYTMKMYDQATTSYAQQYPLLRANAAFLFEYGHSLHFTGDYARSNMILAEGAVLSGDPMFQNVMGNNHKALGDPSRAEKCYLRASQQVPNRIYPLYLLAKLYHDTGQTDQLEDMARQVASFNEKVPSSATKEIKKEVKTWINLK